MGDVSATRDRAIKKLVSSREFSTLNKQIPITAKYAFPPDLVKGEQVLNKCAITIAVFFDEGDHLTMWHIFAVSMDGKSIYMMDADGIYVPIPNIN